uniref:DUF938 domain-containing protein n=1 Tax=Chelydra serpentina TaxID=8475 RepID=A0A8C3SES0_CHESE
MLVSPVAERNKELILAVLADYMDNTGQAFGLELASGTGQHVVHFAQALPHVTWQPSEISPKDLWTTKVQNVKKPLAIDVSQPWEQWAGLSQGCCNVIVIPHPLESPGQPYPPETGTLLSALQSSVGFLTGRNPAWGLRDVEELRQLATPNALRLERMVRFRVVGDTGRCQGLGLSCREPRRC